MDEMIPMYVRILKTYVRTKVQRSQKSIHFDVIIHLQSKS